MLSDYKFRKILKEYEDLQDNIKRDINSKKLIIYRVIPRVKEIDDEISIVSLNIARNIIIKNEEELNKLKEKLKELIVEKESLFKANGVEEYFLTPKYKCKLCKDTGYIQNKRCKCFNQKIIENIYGMYKLKDKLKYENFDKFNFELFSNEKDNINPVSPNENIKFIFKISQNFVKYFDDKFQNILFYGESGTGKTYLCNCIAKELIEREKVVIYSTAFELFELIEKKKFNREEYLKLEDESLDLITEADLLIIDDLGTEFITSLSSAELFNIVNLRILKSKSTLITTNLTMEKIELNYSTRLTSRLYGHYEILKIFGKDNRKNSKKSE